MRQVFGVILAGGQALRMGGVDKALLRIGGEPILSLLRARLAPQCDGLALNANGDPARFAAFGLPIVADGATGFLGPLAGVLAGLDYASAIASQACDIVTVPGDTPFAPADLVARLRASRDATGASIAVAASGDRVHHAVALWPSELRDDLRRALVEEDVRKVSAFIARYTHTIVTWPTAPVDPFFNVNRPDDLAVAESCGSKGRRAQ
ncbi:MAG TPA: molybdenum cofactor guanylyltransferase MobA [Methylocystis sp.]|nr:molybdenum cofactor guanylyltransferase MobA [Methylocystis sp.]